MRVSFLGSVTSRRCSEWRCALGGAVPPQRTCADGGDGVGADRLRSARLRGPRSKFRAAVGKGAPGAGGRQRCRVGTDRGLPSVEHYVARYANPSRSYLRLPPVRQSGPDRPGGPRLAVRVIVHCTSVGPRNEMSLHERYFVHFDSTPWGFYPFPLRMADVWPNPSRAQTELGSFCLARGTDAGV